MKRIAVLGSTGSVGQQTLDVVRQFPHHFRVIGLAARQNATLLEEQAREFRAELICCERDDSYLNGRIRERSLRAQLATIEEIASHPDVDIVVVATGGKAGLAPTLAAIRAGKVVALANKEVLVMAGQIVTREAKINGAEIRPVDSEHSAIWQCLWGEDSKRVERLILTASGGAFRDKSLEDLVRATAEDALRHPTWNMGHRITVDSATLFNKGMETIEARWLFDVPFDKIEVLMHRESIIHSLIEFVDGSLKAQLGVPDMRLPIQCALTYPERMPASIPTRLDLSRMGSLNFGKPDLQRFPCLSLVMEAGRSGGTYPAVAAAADEVAVEHFLARRIGFMEIPRAVETSLAAHKPIKDPTLEEVLDADSWARSWAEDWIKAKAL